MTFEYKSISFKASSTGEDNDFFYFEGYASTFDNIDQGNDVVMKGAFLDSISQKMPKMVYQHQLADLIGVFDSAKEDDYGLYVKGRLPKANTQSNNVGVLMKCGALNTMSIGYLIDKYDLKNNVRYLKKLNLLEISPVTLPMNEKAVIQSVKGVTPFKDYPIAPKGTKWDNTAAIERVRKFTGSDDEPSAKYKNCFMWFDAENTDKFGAYKLPYVDVVDGKLMAVPRAIYAIAAVLNGGRGGTTIPKDEQEKIKNVVKKYYDKMDMDDPFTSDKSEDDYDDEEDKRSKDDEESDDKTNKPDPEMDDEDMDQDEKLRAEPTKRKKSLDILDLKYMGKKGLENVLRESGTFSKSACVYLASLFPSNQSESVGENRKTNSFECELIKLKSLLTKFKVK